MRQLIVELDCEARSLARILQGQLTPEATLAAADPLTMLEWSEENPPPEAVTDAIVRARNRLMRTAPIGMDPFLVGIQLAFFVGRYLLSESNQTHAVCRD